MLNFIVIFPYSMSEGSSETPEASRKKMNPAEKCNNFMRQFRDADSRELKKLTANQFMEVWSHYDEDGQFFYISKYLVIQEILNFLSHNE